MDAAWRQPAFRRSRIADQSRRKGQFRTARDVFDFREGQLPLLGDKLAEGQYLDIVALDLKANGVDLPGKTISPDILRGIVLHP